MNKWCVVIGLLIPGFICKAQGIMLNELSASVSNSQVDNYGEYEDWIEIYNGTKSDVDLAGWYLSDSPKNHLKWRIPATNSDLTTIHADSYLLLWADKDTAQGPQHLGFALKRKGESVYLSRPGPDGPILVDSVRFGLMLTDHSYGRCPERNNQWVKIKHPTPNKPNICPLAKRK